MSPSPTKIRRLDSSSTDFSAELNGLLGRTAATELDAQQIETTVTDIIAQVRNGGDQALLELTARFDSYTTDVAGLSITSDRLQYALETIPAEQREALQYSAQRIKNYHQRQLQSSWDYQEADGTRLGQKVTPIKRVGLYVPGGKASYPSTVLMNAIPAKVAGVGEIVMVSPTPNGELNEMVLAAAAIAGVDQVLRIGGAQAVAALAYGTESIAAVDKITGPGNIYVATAKRQVFGKVGIDMLAGPSEVLVIADQSVNPDWVAMDLFAQAEHDQLAQSILLTQSQEMAELVAQAIEKLLPQMPRRDIIAQALSDNGAIIIAHNQQVVIDIANTIAAEHLQIFTEDAELLAAQIDNAGAIFIGPYSAESLGDYCAGPNHTLPTSGTARFSSPLGVTDFQKRTSIIQVSQQGAQEMAKNASIMAHGESLTAHARSAEFRIKPTDA